MAPKPENVVDVAIALDKQSAAEYARQVGASQTLMQTFVRNVSELGPVSAKSGDKLGEVFVKARQKAHDLAEEARRLPVELDKAAAAAGNLQEKTSGGGGLSLSAFRMGARAANQLGLPGAEIARTAGEVGELGKVFNELAPSLGLATISTEAFTAALGPIAIIAGGAAIAFKLLSDAMEAGNSQVKQALDQLDLYFKLIQDGTSDAIKAQIKVLEGQKQAKLDEIKVIRDANASALADVMKRTGFTEKTILDTNPVFAETGKKLKQLGDEAQGIQDNIDTANRALTSTKVAANDAAIAADKLNTQLIKTFIGGIGNVIGQTIEQAKQVEKDTLDRDKRMIDVQKKYNDDVKSINEKDYQARIDLSKKFADKQIEIAEKALADGEAALSKLLGEQEKLKLDFTRNEAQTERKQAFDDNEVKIKAQVEETKALRDHLQELQDIQLAGRRRERDFLLNRNFLGLFLSQQQTTDELTDSNKKFVQTQKDATDALKQQTDETVRQRAFERQERLIAYQERLADAQAQYKRELVQIDANKKAQLALAQRAYNNELTALTNKTNQELAIKRAGYVQELTLASKTAQQRLEIQQQTDAAYLQMANNTLAAIQQKADDSSTFSSTSTTGQTITRFASGGPIRAGQLGHVNDPGSPGHESFGALRFPGEGIFMPFHSGTINPNGGGTTINATFNIDGSLNPEKVSQIVNQKLYKYMSN